MLAPQPIGIPVPNPSTASKPYWEGCARGELLYQRCDGCGTIALRPGTVCGSCLSRSLSWVQSTGQGSLYSWTVVWRPQRPSFADETTRHGTNCPPGCCGAGVRQWR